ncbi:MAG TPA: aldolase/citrate lyase family protein [Edaphocola sp.]|nr:aldolase/citrate lyase family protein [Edaphocola sp.]
MTGIKVFQCIPAYKPAVSARQIRYLSGSGCHILLDIEDSIQDVQHPELTAALKRKARHELEEIIGLTPGTKFSLRINAVWHDEFQQDKYLLEKFPDRIESIFIPKVESAKDLEAFYAAVARRYRLNLIIETQKGIENLDETLRSTFRSNIDHVFFGNYDYHLDNNIYPIVEQYSPDYWKIVEPIINKVESYRLKFGNSPYADLGDQATLDFSVKKLHKLCHNDFAVMSLHKAQTRHFQNMIWNRRLSPAEMKNNPPGDYSLSIFTRYKQKGRSFSLVDKKIITPQEYLLMLKGRNG